MIEIMLNYQKIQNNFNAWHTAKPFPYAVVDDFFPVAIANELADEFPDFNSPVWHEYNNPIEIKKVSNIWGRFPPTTYRVFNYLNSAGFVRQLAEWIGIETLFADNGLNGGGWHIHARGGV